MGLRVSFKSMRNNQLSEAYFEGLLSLEQVGENEVKPWRLPHRQRKLFPSPGDTLMARAGDCSSPRHAESAA